MSTNQPPHLEVTPPTSPRPARCIECGYVLEGIPGNACPGCSRAFTLSDPRTFTTKPPIRYFAFFCPVLILVIVAVFASTMLAMLSLEQWGWGTWIGVPLAMGILLGYFFRFVPVVGLSVAILVCCAVAMLLFIFGSTGAFCAFTLAGISILPLALGTVGGGILRWGLKRTNFSQGAHLPILALLAASPITLGILASTPGDHDILSVSTRRDLAGSPAAVWNALLFFEDVDREPPLLLQLGLPTPLGREGELTKVGDRTTCIYDSGTVVKEATELEAQERFAFKVVEQDIHFEHDVELISGSFQLHPGPDGGTTIELTTTYRPLLGPRWLWQPIETAAVRSLHGHVLASIDDRAREEAPPEVFFAFLETFDADLAR